MYVTRAFISCRDYADQSGYNGSMSSDPRYMDQSHDASGYPYTEDSYRFDESQQPVGHNMSYQDDRRDPDPYNNSTNPHQDSFHGDPHTNEQRAQYSPNFDPNASRYSDDHYSAKPDDSYDARPVDNRYGDDRHDDQSKGSLREDPYQASPYNQSGNSPRRYADNPTEERSYAAPDNRYGGDDRYGDQPDDNRFQGSPLGGDRYQESPVVGADPYGGDQYSPHSYRDGPPEAQPYGAPHQGDDNSERTASPPIDRRGILFANSIITRTECTAQYNF